MFKRLHTLRDTLYTRFMLFMTRHFGPKLAHVNDEPFIVLWNPASAHFCPHCDWIYMMWDVAEHCWICPQCGIECHPPLAITEKRAAIMLASPKATVPLVKKGDIARNYHASPEKEPAIVPVGDGWIRKLSTRDGHIITEQELQAYPGIRRTG